jgi:hypothetical protein
LGKKLHVEFIFAADPAVIVVKVSSTPAFGFALALCQWATCGKAKFYCNFLPPLTLMIIKNRNEPLSLKRAKRIKKEVFWP